MANTKLATRSLGPIADHICPIAFGSFKIGRNEQIKYPAGYPLPTASEATHLLNSVLDLGINYIDTAPAYGLSEQRIGNAIAHRRDEYILSTKVGETFEAEAETEAKSGASQSHYDYSKQAVEKSITRSLERMKTDHVDIIFIHAHGNDMDILTQTDIVQTLQNARDKGYTRAIGLSGKTPQGALASFAWADAVMLTYNAQDTGHQDVIVKAHHANIPVICKKALASGHLRADQAIAFILKNPHIAAMVLGTLNLDHMIDNLKHARQSR